MRPLEVVLLLADLFAYVSVLLPKPRAPRWLRYPAFAALPIAGAQAVIEGPRWQMIPAYLFGALVFLAGIVRSRRWASTPGKNRPLVTYLGAGLGALGLALSATLAAVLPVFRFPRPHGPYGIGTMTYHWVDSSRPEIFTDDPDDVRELMVQVWYPAEVDPSAPRAPYVEDGRILESTLRLINLPGFILTHLKYVTTNAVPGAPVAGAQPSYPLLIFSHGRGGFRQHNTLQVEELVSHGYIVATIDHPYAASAVRFPDGRLATFDDRMFDSEHPGHAGFLDGVIPFLAQDAIFTLNRLAALNEADPNGLLTGRLDMQRAGIFGSSLGGIVSAEACLLEPRLQSCLVQDVFMPADVVEAGLQQPTLWFSRDRGTMQLEGWTQEDIDETESTIRTTFENSHADRYLVLVPGMFHNEFSDAALLAWPPLARKLGLIGTIDSRRAQQITIDFSLAFFDQHLKGIPSALLDNPTEQYPEVLFEVRRP